MWTAQESGVPGQDPDDLLGHPSDSDSDGSSTDDPQPGEAVFDTWSEFGDTIGPPKRAISGSCAVTQEKLE